MNWMTLDSATGTILEIGEGTRGGTWDGESVDLDGKFVFPVCIKEDGGWGDNSPCLSIV